MKKTLLVLAVLAAPLAAQVPSEPIDTAANAAEIELAGATPFYAERLIVRFVDGADLAVARAILDPAHFVVEEALMPSLGMFLVRIVDGARVPEAIAALSSHPALRYVAPDHVVAMRQTTPNDPSFGSQWCHTKMQSELAWDFGQGSQQFVVSVVDGGCKVNHADLAANIYVNQAEANGTTGVDDDGNGYKDDINGWNAYGNNGNVPNDGHGTHVNGIVGAVGNNGKGVAGVNWNVTLMPVAGASSSTSTVTKAYNYVLAQKQLWISSNGVLGANVVSTNSSFGIDFGNCGSNAYKPWNDAYDAMGAVGILSCAATMNINANVDTSGDVPTGCASPYLVAVTNTTSADQKNSGAAYGLTMIDLGAPGTNIYSTYSSGGYTNMTGTSMASPQVAGAIGFLHSVASPDFAALRDANHDLAALELKDIMLNNVDALASLQGKTVSGGRLNLYQSAQAINSWTPGGIAGTVASYGAGLGGANIGGLSSVSTPNIGTTLVMDVSGFPNSSSMVMMISTGRDVLPLLGGTLLIDITSMIANVPFTVTGGNSTIGLPLPMDVGLVGFTGYTQCGGLDATQPQGVALSNGLKFVIGM